MLNIIDLLKDDNEYYNKSGKEYLSNSDIGTLLNNPQDFGIKKEDNKIFMDGRYFHQLILEPEKAKKVPFIDSSSRTTKEYKKYCEDNELTCCMLKKEQDDIKRLVKTINSNIVFYDEIYKAGNQYELPAVGVIQNTLWKGKADIVTDDAIIDLKTTSDIHRFKYTAKMYNYDSQCYIYQELFKKPLVFYAIDKVTGVLGVFNPTEDFIKGGEIKVSRAIEIYNKYFSKTPTDNISNYYISDYLY